MKKSFRSNDFLFRPSGMSAAFQKLGVTTPHLVREPKISGMLRAKQDKADIMPSVFVHITPRPEEKVA